MALNAPEQSGRKGARSSSFLAHRWLCFGSAAIGLAALSGWCLGVRPLRSWVPGSISMNPVTGLCFVVLAGILLRKRTEERPGRAWAAAGAALILLGALQLLDAFVGTNFRLDHLLFSAELAAASPPFGNRMAPNTAIAFALTGAVMLLSRRGESAIRAAQIILALNFLGAVFAVLGYLYNVDGLYRVSAHPPMALNTALAFLLANAALALDLRDRGLFAPLAQPTVGGQLARRLLPWILLLPPMLGWLRVIGERKGWYEGPAGSAIMVAVWMLALGALVLWTAHSMNEADLKRAEAERALERHARELEAAQRELESFSYSVSHDLRAPLRHVSGFINLLEGSLPNADATAKRYLKIINQAAVQMGRLIDDLLTFSRLGRAEMSSTAVDLNRLMSEVIADAEADAKGRAIQWQRGALPTVRGDLPMIRQAFLNLLENAVKYTRPVENAVIQIFAETSAEGDCVIGVRDNGAGFDMKYADKLFGVFQRLHRSEDFEGTGIGLANVRRVAARHGGTTWASGEVGKGAVFYVSLPKERVVP